MNSWLPKYASYVLSGARQMKATKAYASFRQLRRSVKEDFKWVYSRFNRSRSRAKFIAVTGSSAKTTTVALLSHILSETATVGTLVEENSFQGIWDTFGSARHDDYVVMEIGTAKPGEIAKMARVVRPHIAIITLVELQHHATFRNKEAVAKEKASLVEALGADGLAILNRDDPRVLAMSDSTQARVITFGTAGADYSQHNVCSEALGQLTFDLDQHGRRIRLRTCLSGAHNTVAVSAAAACALELGVPEPVIVSRVASFQPYFGRQSVHPVPEGPLFILDTAKAPYDSIFLCLDVLKSCAAPRKRFVLGAISDYAGSPVPKYRSVYQAALECADQVIFVGPGANKSRASPRDIEQGKFLAFASVEDASRYIRATGRPDEVILIKGSKNLHLERLMLDWTAEVRCWPDACGVDNNCEGCGLYARPFAEHSGKTPKARPWQRRADSGGHG